MSRRVSLIKKNFGIIFINFIDYQKTEIYNFSFQKIISGEEESVMLKKSEFEELVNNFTVHLQEKSSKKALDYNLIELVRSEIKFNLTTGAFRNQTSGMI